jgi:hypothetical protein
MRFDKRRLRLPRLSKLPVTRDVGVLRYARSSPIEIVGSLGVSDLRLPREELPEC